MRLRNVKNAKEIVKNHPLVINEVVENTFPNKKAIHLEIGMGKGDFIINMSKKYPNINFVAIEKYESIIVKALEKIDKSDNLRIICMDAKNLNEIFNEKIEALYLNFSDPWPKKRHAKRRLTHPNFLNIFENLFKKEVNIFLKTDNKDLFAYSLVSLSNNGYQLIEVSLNLANSDISNVETEYEHKFSGKGETINYLHATKKI